jgi:hypothetical protein
MANEVFTFCPSRTVPETLPPESASGTSFNGWTFTAKPGVPYQRKFKLTMHGLRWYTDPDTELYDIITNPDFNARVLEQFYERHQTWKPFDWTHQHLGLMVVRFANPVTVPAAPKNNSAWLDPLEITLVHHNPGF